MVCIVEKQSSCLVLFLVFPADHAAGTLAYMAPEVFVKAQSAALLERVYIMAGTNRMDIYRSACCYFVHASNPCLHPRKPSGLRSLRVPCETHCSTLRSACSLSQT
jgi:hypothetical protein